MSFSLTLSIVKINEFISSCSSYFSLAKIKIDSTLPKNNSDSPLENLIMKINIT